MNPIKPKNLEDIIISILLKEGSLKTTDLLDKTRELRTLTTKQGFYKTLRYLIKNEILVIYNKQVSIDSVWLQKMKNLFVFADGGKDNLLRCIGLENSVNYTFSTIKNLDTFWGYLQDLLIINTDNSPVYSYDPHYWFYIVRKERERYLIDNITRLKRQFLMTVGGSYYLDKYIKKDFNSKYCQYNFGIRLKENNYYITIISDYIIEVFIDKRVSDKIEEIYRSANVLDNDMLNILKNLINIKSKNKLKISKNKEKSKKLISKLKRGFYFQTKE